MYRALATTRPSHRGGFFCGKCGRCGSTAPRRGSPPFPRRGVFLGSCWRAAQANCAEDWNIILVVGGGRLSNRGHGRGRTGHASTFTTSSGPPGVSSFVRALPGDVLGVSPYFGPSPLLTLPTGSGSEVAGGMDAPARRMRIADRSGDALSRNNPARAGVVPARGRGLGVAL